MAEMQSSQSAGVTEPMEAVARFPTSCLTGKRAYSYFDVAIQLSIFFSKTANGSAPVFST